MRERLNGRQAERGGAGVKFLIVIVVILLIAHAGYQYLPVAYAAENFRSEMQTAVLQGLALPGKASPVDNVKARVQRAAASNELPADALIEVKQNGNNLTVHVAYVKTVDLLPFGMYRYDYVFDHTATPTGFLTK
jgi:hypothetical protein